MALSSIIFCLFILVSALVTFCFAKYKLATYTSKGTEGSSENKSPYVPIQTKNAQGNHPRYVLRWEWCLGIYGSMGIVVGAILKLSIIHMLLETISTKQDLFEREFLLLLIVVFFCVITYYLIAIHNGQESGIIRIRLCLSLGMFVFANLHMSFSILVSFIYY